MALVTRKSKRGKRGMASVEMALAVGLLVTLTFAGMEYGWVFLRLQEVTNAARAGARYAVIPDATAAGIDERVNTLLSGAGIATYSLSVSPEDVTAALSGDPVTVTVAVPYADLALLGMFPTPATLQASATMAKEMP